MSATSASLLRNEWSPSTKMRVTGPGMAAVSRSSSSGVAKASRRPETKRHGRRKLGEVLGAEALGASRRVERVADQDQRGSVEALGGGQGAHPPSERATADGDPPGRDGESLRQRRPWRRAPSGCRPPADRCGACRPPARGTRRARRPRRSRVTASSMATSPDCPRPALAPGVSTSPAMPRGGHRTIMACHGGAGGSCRQGLGGRLARPAVGPRRGRVAARSGGARLASSRPAGRRSRRQDRARLP